MMIQLEKFTTEDYTRLISWIDSTATLMQFAGPAFSFPLTSDQLDASLSDVNRHAFKVIETETHKTIGHAEIYFKEASAFFGRILIGDKSMRNKGTGLLIVQQLIDFVKERTDVKEIELYVFDWNVAAIRCYEKAGFKVNAEKKAERKVAGKIWTAVNMVFKLSA
jgi:RimJ/RimL family protein N-acetyltransferase